MRQWVAKPPAWIEVNDPGEILWDDVLLKALDDGEKAAIALALALPGALLLMDDRDGVTAARERGLAVTGTIGVLDRTAKSGLIDLANAFARLRLTNFIVPNASCKRC